MPDMRGVGLGGPSNKRTAAAKAQQDEEDGGWVGAEIGVELRDL